MKTSKFLMFILAIICCNKVFAQAQPKGEFHKYILKTTDEERRKTKNQEWWNKGVIVFANNDIPRLGSINEIKPILKNEFKSGEKFTGRVYLWNSIGEMNPKPVMIYYHLFVDGKKVETRVVAKGENLPDNEWSSWLIDFPDYFQGEWEKIANGKHLCKIECWSAFTVDETTIYTDEFGKELGAVSEKKGKYKFLASGEFDFLNGEATNDELIVDETMNEMANALNDQSAITDTTWTQAWYKGNPVYDKQIAHQICDKNACSDLVLKNIHHPVFDGSSIYQFEVHNIGNVRSRETNAVLSIKSIYTNEIKYYLEVNIPEIESGQKVNLEFSIEFKNIDQDPDELHKVIIVDYDENIDEQDEDNNTFTLE